MSTLATDIQQLISIAEHQTFHHDAEVYICCSTLRITPTYIGHDSFGFAVKDH